MYPFRKKDPGRPKSFNLKVMHIFNAVAIGVFVLAILYRVIKYLFFNNLFR